MKKSAAKTKAVKAPAKVAAKAAPKAAPKTASAAPSGRGRRPNSGSQVNRILVGVRIEPRLVKVMKAMSELHDCALGELIERVFWTSLEGGSLFAEKGRLSADAKKQIESLKQVYGVDYDLDYLAKKKKD